MKQSSESAGTTGQINTKAETADNTKPSSDDGEHLGRKIDSALETLNDLLGAGPASIEDRAFPVTPDQERRSEVRHPFLAEVVAVLKKPHCESQAADTAESDANAIPSAFRMIHGWTMNLSPNSVCFVLPEHVEVDQLLLLIDHPDYQYPLCCFTARIFRVRAIGDGEWEYGAVVRPLTNAASPLHALSPHMMDDLLR